MSDSLFESVSFADADTAARRDGRFLVVDFTAQWCGPCQAMEKTTWRDDQVRTWMRAHAHVIQVDVDKEPEVSARFNVRAMPTVLALKDGQEVDRFVGGRPAAGVLSWCEGLLKGETELDRLRKDAGSGPLERANFAKALVMSGKLDEATDEYLWLWQHALEAEPALIGVKYSYWLAELADLTQRSPKARAAFASQRDASAPSPQLTDSEKVRLADWLALNQVLADDEKSLAWFDEVKASLSAAQRSWLARWLAEPLKERERWEDLSLVYPDPLSTLNQEHATHQEMLAHLPAVPDGFSAEEMKKHLAEFAAIRLRQKAQELVSALRAAGREELANAVAARAVELDPGPEMTAAVQGRPH